MRRALVGCLAVAFVLFGCGGSDSEETRSATPAGSSGTGGSAGSAAGAAGTTGLPPETPVAGASGGMIVPPSGSVGGAAGATAGSAGTAGSAWATGGAAGSTGGSVGTGGAAYAGAGGASSAMGGAAGSAGAMYTGGTAGTGGGTGGTGGVSTGGTGGGATGGAAGATGGAAGVAGTGGGSVYVPTLTAGMWDDNANYNVFLNYTASQGNYANVLPLFDRATTDAARAGTTQRGAFNAIDIALVLDTTGSMADELSYLQNEFKGISSAVSAQFPTADVRWSLVVYRDAGDEYVTRGFDFTNVVSTFQTNLAAQRSNGGGDEPEAVPDAFQAALAQSWRGATAAQMLLWVADAPHHDFAVQNMRAALTSTKDKGIRIYPVAASNANPLCIATMRIGAQVTGGRYIFLTNDSGVGGGHSEPPVMCYYVTKLNDAIVRSVAMELTGKYVAPSPDAIVRVVGTPVGDTCAQPVVPDAGGGGDAPATGPDGAISAN